MPQQHLHVVTFLSTCYDCSCLSLFSFFSHSSADLLVLINPFLTVLSERLTPKRSFPLLHAMHGSIFLFPLTDIFLFMHD